MAIALSLEKKEYVLKVDLDLAEDQQTKFQIRPLKFHERCSIQDSLMLTEWKGSGPKDVEETNFSRLNTGTVVKETILAGLVEISNFKKANGEVLEYRADMPKAKRLEVLNYLSQEWLNELAEAIRAMSVVGKEEEKN
jgi:hypothetical protein